MTKDELQRQIDDWVSSVRYFTSVDPRYDGPMIGPDYIGALASEEEQAGAPMEPVRFVRWYGNVPRGFCAKVAPTMARWLCDWIECAERLKPEEAANASSDMEIYKTILQERAEHQVEEAVAI